MRPRWRGESGSGHAGSVTRVVDPLWWKGAGYGQDAEWKQGFLRPRATSGDRLWLEFHISVDISGKPLRIFRRLGNVIVFEFRWFRFTAHPHLKSHKTWPNPTNYQQLILLDLCILLLWHLTFPRAQAYGVLHVIIHSRIGVKNAGCHL